MPLNTTRAVKPPKKTHQRGGGRGGGGGGPSSRHKARLPQDADAKVYRDRAAERREGGVGDYADSEQLLSHLNSTSNDRQAAYEQSKYLGGDVARTHLVRGLDYLLLEKMRGSNGTSTSPATTDLDNEVDRLLCAPPSGDAAPPAAEKMPEANTAVGKQVMAAVQQIYKTRIDRRNMPSSASDLFMPGRMCFEIRVAAANGAVRATTRIRSQDEVPAAGHSAHNGNSCDRAVLTKVIAAIAAGRHRRIEARYLQEQYADKPPAVDAPAAVVGAGAVGDAEDEEDIFAEAGVDYREEDEAVTAPYPKKEDDAVSAPHSEREDEEECVTAPYPVSEDEGATAPYPMSEDERVTAPYPMSEADMVDDHSADEDNESDAALFALARSRFKEEAGELLSRPVHRQGQTSTAEAAAKRKAATLQSNEWNKTRRILENKYQKEKE